MTWVISTLNYYHLVLLNHTNFVGWKMQWLISKSDSNVYNLQSKGWRNVHSGSILNCLFMCYRLNDVEVEARAEFPGLPIHVSLDGGSTWQSYVPGMIAPSGTSVVAIVRCVALAFHVFRFTTKIWKIVNVILPVLWFFLFGNVNDNSVT